MRFRTHPTLYLALIVVSVTAVLAGFVPSAAAPVAHAEPDAPMDTPTTIVSDTFNEWTVSDGLAYWAERCYGGEFRGDGYLKRKPTGGGATKTLANVNSANCLNFLSMVADSTGIYYYKDDGARLEYRASGSPYDPPTLISTVASGQWPRQETQLVHQGDYVYWFGLDNRIHRIKTDGTGLATIATTGAYPKDMLVYPTVVYWLDTTGFWRVNTDCGSLPCTSTKQQVTTTSSDAHSLLYSPGGTVITYAYYWAEGGDIKQLSCNSLTGRCAKGTFYSGPWTVGDIARGGNTLFWVEQQFTTPSGGGFPYVSDARVRRQQIGTTTTQTIATGMADLYTNIYADASWVYFARYQTSPSIMKLPVAASAITFDLQASQWEVTQAIQNTANQAPLVAKRATYVRVYGRDLAGPTAPGVEARLIGTRGGSPLPGSPLSPLDGVLNLTAGGSYDRGNATDGWLFKLPESWTTSGGTVLRAEVDPRGFYDDTNPGNNALQGTFTFQNQPPACVVTLPVWTHTPDPKLSDPNVMDMIRRYSRLWPVPEVWTYKVNARAEEAEVCWWGPFPYPCTGPLELEEDASVLNLLADRDDAILAIAAIDLFTDDPDACDNIGAPVHYMGMVHPSANTGSVAGYASLLVNSSWVKLPPRTPNPFANTWNAMFQGPVMAQELTHNYNRGHVNCGSPSGVDSGYPYPPCQLDNAGANNYYGFDPVNQQPIPPNQASDFMSYSPNTGQNPNWQGFWVSDYTWRALMGAFAAAPTGASATAAAAPLAPDAGAVYVSGALDHEANTGRLSYLKMLPAAALSTGMQRKWQERLVPEYSEAAGTAAEAVYHVRLLAAGGAVLADRNVTPLETDDHVHGDPALFMATFPAPAGVPVKAQLLADSTLLDERTFGPAVPAVTVTQPAAGASVGADLTIQWQATDADNDILLYTVQYSYDNGVHWQTLATDLPGTPANPVTTLVLQGTDGLHGSNGQNARIRVLASDGYNTGSGLSGAFSVSDRKPQPAIAAPVDGHWYRPDEPMVLSGGADDTEDGGIPGANLSWQVDGAAAGTGRDVPVAGLAPGAHTISLTAKDSANQQATATSKLNILPLSVPAGSAPVLDGACGDASYADGVALRLQPYGDGAQAAVHLLRTSDALFACFAHLKKGATSPGAFAGVRIDANNSRNALAQADDYGFFVGEDGGVFTYAGNGSGGFANPGPAGLQAQVSAGATTWDAELRIPADTIGGWDHAAGLKLGHYWVSSQGNDYGWPYTAVSNKPNTWAASAFGAQPEIISLDPVTATRGGTAFTLTVDGAGFVSGATVRWNGAALPTTFVSSTRLTAQVAAGQLVGPGKVDVTVANPGNFISNATAFTVLNPAPAITRLSPNATAAEGPAFTLAVTGSGFVTGATIYWQGSALPTTFISGTEVRGQVTAGLIAQGGAASIDVRNPEPNAGTSNIVSLTITPKGGRRQYLPLIAR